MRFNPKTSSLAQVYRNVKSDDQLSWNFIMHDIKGNRNGKYYIRLLGYNFSL